MADLIHKYRPLVTFISFLCCAAIYKVVNKPDMFFEDSVSIYMSGCCVCPRTYVKKTNEFKVA